MHPGNYTEAKAIIEESYELYGDKIVLVHAKDFVLEEGQIKTVPLGRGLMDYHHLLTIARKYKPGIEVIIEDLRDDELREIQLFLRRVLDEL